MNTGRRSLNIEVGKFLGDYLMGLGAFRLFSFSYYIPDWRELLTEGGKVRS